MVLSKYRLAWVTPRASHCLSLSWTNTHLLQIERRVLPHQTEYVALVAFTTVLRFELVVPKVRFLVTGALMYCSVC